MQMDKFLEFADAVSVAAAASTALIGSQIDLGASHRDIGVGAPLYLVITTDTEIITGGSAGTIQFKLSSDDTASISTTTATDHWVSRLFVTDDSAANDAQMNAGGVIAVVALPQEGAVYERYLGILCVIATTTVTAGKINAFLTEDPSKWAAYADASN